MTDAGVYVAPELVQIVTGPTELAELVGSMMVGARPVLALAGIDRAKYVAGVPQQGWRRIDNITFAFARFLATHIHGRKRKNARHRSAVPGVVVGG